MLKMWTIFIIFVMCTNARALNDAEGRKMFEDHVKKCAEEKHIDLADLTGLQKLQAPDKTEIKCVLACTYKALETLNNEGMYDVHKAYEFAELMKDGDDKRLENGKKVADLCLTVNDEPVSDGTQGCDRATLMFKCMIETAPKYGFKLE